MSNKACAWLAICMMIGVMAVTLPLVTLGSGMGRQPAPAAASSAVIVAHPALLSSHSSVLSPQTSVLAISGVPILLSPADGTPPANLDTPVTFAWQPVSDPSASYNLEFQYSHDGNTWFKPEIVYGIIGTSYQRRNRFLEYGYARWRVWATTYSGDSARSDWRQMPLPPQTPGG